MAKFFGNIGFVYTEEVTPGVWKSIARDVPYYGEVLNNWSKRWNGSNDINDDLELNNTISILFDEFASQHLHHIKYIWYMGTRWKVTMAEIEYPRILLTLGGEYNGEKA